MVAALLITEISSPFLHLREILKEIGYRNTELNFAADVSHPFIFPNTILVQHFLF